MGIEIDHNKTLSDRIYYQIQASTLVYLSPGERQDLTEHLLPYVAAERHDAVQEARRRLIARD